MHVLVLAEAYMYYTSHEYQHTQTDSSLNELGSRAFGLAELRSRRNNTPGIIKIHTHTGFKLVYIRTHLIVKTSRSLYSFENVFVSAPPRFNGPRRRCLEEKRGRT